VDVNEFHQIVLKLLSKKGDLSDPRKWRPIALLDVMSNIVSAIIANRLDEFFQILRGLKEQAGFMSDR
jgi:hypothetical protein